jgi:hypothetical protein
MLYYNGLFLHDKEVSSAGLGPLGIEHVAQKGFVCRGVVLDAVALRGGPLPVPKENSASDPGIVTARDVEEMVKRQGIAPIVLTGADTWGAEAVGKDFGGESAQPFECHATLQTRRGIWNLENLDLSQLVADKAYEFLFVWSPLKMKGGDGLAGEPGGALLGDVDPSTHRSQAPKAPQTSALPVAIVKSSEMCE